jgi:hypothetical protein
MPTCPVCYILPPSSKRFNYATQNFIKNADRRGTILSIETLAAIRNTGFRTKWKLNRKEQVYWHRDRKHKYSVYIKSGNTLKRNSESLFLPHKLSMWEP